MAEWTARDSARAQGVDGRLVTVIKEAFARWRGEEQPTVTEGVRTLARQKELVAKGASKTMASRHLDGYAIDVCMLTPDRKALVTSAKPYTEFARLVAQAGNEQGLSIRWGGSWRHISGRDCHDYPYIGARFFDGPHFEVPAGYEK